MNESSEKPERGDGETHREGEKLQAGDLGFRQKCQMSQRHSGKALLFNMAPWSVMEAENVQWHHHHNHEHLQ